MAKVSAEAKRRYDRFHDLTQSQIRRILELDELARNATTRPGIEEIVSAYHATSCKFTEEDALRYARKAEEVGRLGVATEWYSWWATCQPIGDAERVRRSVKLKEYFIRHGLIREIKWRMFACTDAERGAAARVALEKNIRFDYLDDTVHEVLVALRRAKDRHGIRLFLEKALCEIPGDALVAAAARAFGRSLTTRERERIARRMLKKGAPQDAFQYIRKHRLSSLYSACIKAAARDGKYGVKYREIRRWATALRVPLHMRDLERGFAVRFARNSSGFIDDAIEFAEALARSSPRICWQERLPRLYKKARTKYLEWDNPEMAERYGRRCGKPLTPEELLAIVASIKSAVANGYDWAIKRRAYCLDRAAELIATAIGVPPDAPATAEHATA